MDKIFRIFGREYGNINQAAFLLGIFAFLSQILGLLRDRSIAHFIGPSPMLDAYYAAFRIPDIIFVSIASLASITVLIPFIVSRMSDGKITASARKFLNDTFTAFFFVMILVSIIMFFIMPHLLFFIAPGFTPDLQAKTILLSRIMLLSPIFLGLSNLFGSITQLFRKFFIFSLSPIVYNAGIIIGVIFLYPSFGINGLVAGVVLGALMHFLIQFFASSHFGFLANFSFKINWNDTKKLVL
ncbi:MAG: lipid II flippase MurJ, partial [Patescibacteria group bacterium]